MMVRPKTFGFAFIAFLVATPGLVQGTAKSPLPIKVSASRIREINGTTCAYLPASTRTVGLKNLWTAGSRKGDNHFVTFSETASFYKSKGPRYRAKYRQARADAKAGAISCRRLTALRFKTSGIVGAALATSPKVTKKSIRPMASSKVAIAGLYGITSTGKAASIISAVSSKDEVAVQSTSITRVFQSPDGALIIHYANHPNSCVIGRVSSGMDFEVCIVLNIDLPEGFRVYDAGGFVTDRTELVQFDQVGGIYLNIAGPAKHIGCTTAPRESIVETIFVVNADGMRDVLLPSKCADGIMTWSTLDNGGAVYAQGNNEWIGTVNVWREGENVLLKDGLLLTPNGIHSVSDGKIVLLVHSFAPTFNPSTTFSQGGVLVYDQTTGVFVNWLHLRSNNPKFATEDIFAACGCSAATLYPSGATSNGNELFGVTNGHVVTQSQSPLGFPIIRSFPIATRLYPTVSMLTQLPTGYTAGANSVMSAATEQSLVVAGSDYLTCTIGSLPRSCTYQMGLVDLEDGSYTELVSPAEGIATLTLSAQTDGDLILAQAVRISNGRYLIGIVNQISKTIAWSDTSTINYRFITALH